VDDQLRDALESWDLGTYEVEPFGRGMGSRTWLVRCSNEAFVAKASAGGVQLDRGLEAADLARAAGLRTSAPIRTSHGELTAPIGEQHLSLMTFVPGRPADEKSSSEVRSWGRTLGAMHRALAGHEELAEGLPRLPLIDLDQDHLDIESWIRPAIDQVVEEVMRFRGTVGFLHADPAQEAFLIDDAGDVGIIDWTSCWWGPLMFDLASARMYTGADAFPDLLDAYLEVAPTDTCELDLFVRFRWCVQAAYFSWRVANDVMTGIDDLAENRTGLSDARINLIGR
jgi:Ser/Thr protein kinase RdoA (MazF antagonist)